MSIALRSFGKINLGLRIGLLRPDGFHELRTVYQTIALYDVVRVRVGRGSGIEIRCADARVPTDQSNTCYRMVERAIAALKARGRVVIEIEKRLPVQGGLGGASGNAVAALVADVCRTAGVATLLVAHDVNPLLSYLDRVVYLAAGHAVEGPVAEVITTQTLSGLYGVPVEVLRASDGRLVVVGQPEAPAHHHDRHEHDHAHVHG